MPPLTEPWKSRTDDELADNAQSGLQGQGAVVEAMRRLRESNEKLTRLLIGLTVVSRRADSRASGRGDHRGR